jgi:hypothetical protein
MAITNYLPSSRLIQPGVCTSSTRPATPFEGQAIFETDTDRMLIWNGTTWVIPNAPAQNPTGLELITPTSVAGTGVALSGANVTYSATTSISVNGCFSSLYSNYRVLIASTIGSVDGQILLQMRSNGTDATGSTDYDYSASQYNYGTLLNLGSSSGGSSAVIGYKIASAGSSMSLDFYNPFITRNTLFSGVGQYVGLILNAGGQHKQAVSYDGFTLTSGAGTMTGVVTVYGYRN